MTEDKVKRSEKSMLGKASSLFRRGREEGTEELLSHESYWVGDIREERLVQIETGATVAGNVVAPRVVVAGLVYGSVTAREIVVEVSGQIWGDVYAAALEMVPGGKLNGWVTTLDEGTVDLLRSGEIGFVDLPGTMTPNLGAEDIDSLLAAQAFDPGQSDHWLRIWRQLQAEAAVALMARAEIEATFEERLREATEELSNPQAAEPTRTGGEPGVQESSDPDVELWRKVSAMTAEARLEAQRRLTVKQAEVDVLQRKLADTRVQLADTAQQLDRLRKQAPGPLESESAEATNPSKRTTQAADVQLTSAEQTPNAPWPEGSDRSKELARCLQHLKAQGERLSTLTTELVEREVALSQAQRLLEKRTQQLEHIKALAGKRIRELDREINRLRLGQ